MGTVEWEWGIEVVRRFVFVVLLLHRAGFQKQKLVFGVTVLKLISGMERLGFFNGLRVTGTAWI